MPMKAGAYPLAIVGETRAGTVSAKLDLGGTRFNPTEGTLRIEAWDLAHIAGTFELTAIGPFRKEISIRGRFDCPCRAGKACAK
jgi:hypothetical protein